MKQLYDYVIERRDLFSCCVQVRTHIAHILILTSFSF